MLSIYHPFNSALGYDPCEPAVLGVSCWLLSEWAGSVSEAQGQDKGPPTETGRDAAPWVSEKHVSVVVPSSPVAMPGPGQQGGTV